jgi:ABC transporter substrate binding protein
LGWIVGRNLQSEDRFAAGDERRIRAFAEEIVGRMPDVILARGTQATEGLKQQTSNVPIVFVPVSDPVASGFVTKLRAARRPSTAPFQNSGLFATGIAKNCWLFSAQASSSIGR